MTYDQGELTEVVQSMCSKKEAPKNIFAKKKYQKWKQKNKRPKSKPKAAALNSREKQNSTDRKGGKEI